MREIETLLFTNDAFYQAITDRDLGMLDSLWSITAAASCLHPGWPPLHGRDEVMDSWQRILTGPNPPSLECVAASAHLINPQLGLITCYEQTEGEWLIATNLFIREGTGWSIFHHQSAPAGSPPEEDEVETPSRIN